MSIALIPARGGSKRIPRKNIKNFLGRPMIAYSIEAAKISQVFDRIVVSTDDDEIAETALAYGAEVPFLRPAELSDDFATTLDVMKHAIEQLESDGSEFTNICCIYATAPFVKSVDLRIAYDMLKENACDYVFSATSFAFPIQRAIRLKEGSQVEMFHPDMFNQRSQDLEEAYHDAGQFYWGRKEVFRSKKEIFTGQSYAYLLPRTRVQDIDTAEDWERAELLYKLLENVA